jgi:DMSO/TMAO reductase YedYZ molybdopterin-dependent catalytic subunit
VSIGALGALRREVASDGGRRHWLVLGGVVIASLLVGGAASWVGRGRRSGEAARARLGLRGPGVVPDGADLDVEGLGPWRVSNEDFYRIDTALSVPAVTPEQWRLRIHGMVDRELTLTYDDLLARARTDAWITIACVSNGVGGNLIGNAYWSGVRIAPLLAEVGLQRGADAVLQTSVDGWTCGTPLSVLTDDRNAMLAVAMNGEPLPVEHGFPVRTIVPGLYGFVSATKWVEDFEVSRFDRFTAYWSSRGWSEQAPVKIQSRIEVPRERAQAGRVEVAGTAWAQGFGVERVEVRVDDGPWVRCKLGRVPSVDTWVQWSVRVDCARGNRLLTVRATDRTGRTQPSERQPPAPDGATGWHQVWISAE